jgi:hypothetical protein
MGVNDASPRNQVKCLNDKDYFLMAPWEIALNYMQSGRCPLSCARPQQGNPDIAFCGLDLHTVPQPTARF